MNISDVFMSSLQSSSSRAIKNQKIADNANQPPPQLGIPTANIPISGLTVGGHEDVASGVYYGWAGLSPSPATGDKPAVFPMVMSIGWNPFYKNSVRSVEVHIMHKFEQDFYGSHMNLIILGFIRPEYDYVSLESLVEDIHTDIRVAKDSLEREAYVRFREEGSLVEFGGKSDNAD
jgi:riboflavin kinase